MPSSMPLVHVRLEPEHREKLERVRKSLGLPSEASALRWFLQHAELPKDAKAQTNPKKS